MQFVHIYVSVVLDVFLEFIFVSEPEGDLVRLGFVELLPLHLVPIKVLLVRGRLIHIIYVTYL